MNEQPDDAGAREAAEVARRRAIDAVLARLEEIRRISPAKNLVHAEPNACDPRRDAEGGHNARRNR